MRWEASHFIFILVMSLGAINESYAAAEEGFLEPAIPTPAILLPTMIAPPVNAYDVNLAEVVMARVSTDPQRMDGRKGWRFVDRAELAILGLRKNLAARLAGRQPLLAQEALLEASALFDPVLQVSVNLSVSDQTARSMTTTIYRQTYKQSANNCQELVQTPNASTNNRADIFRLCFAKKDQIITLDNQTVYAVTPSDEHPGKNKTAVTSVGITQQLPWGPVLSVVDTSTYNKTYYSTMGGNYSYDAPWSSSLFASLSMPLPGTKGFGPLAQADYSIKIAQLNNERSTLDVKAAINNILLEIDLAYWNLVSTAESLAVVIENTKLTKLLEPSFSRLYEQNLITNFDNLQFVSELAQAKLDEELALDNFYQASTALAGLLTDKPEDIFDEILFPVGFTYEDKNLSIQPLGEVQELALKKRPEILAQKLVAETKRLAQYFSENQLLPDLRFNISGTFSQDGSVYGYKDITRSLEGLTSPDAISVNTSLAHTYPVGQRAAKANLMLAEANLIAGEYAAKGIKNSVMRQVSDSHAGYSSAKNRIAGAKEGLSIIELAYQLLEKKFKIGENVSQVQLNRNRRDLLAARQAVIAAQIDLRIMETRLIAAQGKLTERYAKTNSENEFERHRIAALEASKILKYFRGDLN